MKQHSRTDLCGGRPETAVPTVTRVAVHFSNRQASFNRATSRELYECPHNLTALTAARNDGPSPSLGSDPPRFRSQARWGGKRYLLRVTVFYVRFS